MSIKIVSVSILVTLLTIISCSKSVGEEDIEVRDDFLFLIGDSLPFSGLVVGYDGDVKRYQVEVTDGLIQEDYVCYDETNQVRGRVKQSETIKKENNDILYHKDESIPLTGYVFSEYGDETPFTEYFVMRGVKHGRYREYYPNGSLKVEVSYRNGEQDGIFQEWYIDGSMKKQSHYLNGVLNGLLISWGEDGDKNQEINYVDGELKGEYKTWDRRGRIVKDGVYKNSEFHGRKYSYSFMGLEEEGYWVGDKPSGEHKHYEKEILRKIITYDEDYQKEKSVIFDQMGNVEYNVQLDGEKEWFYDPQGTFVKLVVDDWEYYPHPYKYEMRYRGNFRGYFHYYDQERTKRKMMESLSDKMERSGKFKEWWENGNIKTEGEYLVGIRVRTWYHYDINGDLIKTEHTIYP